MLEKLFSWGKKQTQGPGAKPNINFGRYSDNNKTVFKTFRWGDSDSLFKEKKYSESIDAFFDYLKDDEAANVQLQRTGDDFHFEICQGSKIVRGRGDAQKVEAEVTLAKMTQPSVAVMRRLLDQNFSLYYSRYALDGDRLCMRFETPLDGASPNKLYYALKELATKADKQDDLLVQDFSSLQSLDSDHIEEVPAEEKEIKFAYFQKWINETLDYCNTLDADKFSGGIAYLLLALSFRLDFLISPEGSLLSQLEKIPQLYYTKDEKPTMEKNAAMIAAFKTVLQMPKEEFFKHLFRSKSTFAIVTPQQHKVIADSVANANTNMGWYRDNNYSQIGAQICEYGISFCQYSYSMPRYISELFLLLMQVNYGSYFAALGFTDNFYDASINRFNSDKIIERIRTLQSNWTAKYPKLDFLTGTEMLKFDNLLEFNSSFTTQIQLLNFDSK